MTDLHELLFLLAMLPFAPLMALHAIARGLIKLCEWCEPLAKWWISKTGIWRLIEPTET